MSPETTYLFASCLNHSVDSPRKRELFSASGVRNRGLVILSGSHSINRDIERHCKVDYHKRLSCGIRYFWTQYFIKFQHIDI